MATVRRFLFASVYSLIALGVVLMTAGVFASAETLPVQASAVPEELGPAMTADQTENVVLPEGVSEGWWTQVQGDIRQDDPLFSSVPWTAEGDQDYAHFGWSVGTAGDVNGDGYSDVIVGHPTMTPRRLGRRQTRAEPGSTLDQPVA
jgi:hypothetical protein